MVRVKVLGNVDLLRRSDGAASFILRDFYAGLAAVAFLFITMLMVAARRGRGRGRGRGRSQDVTERQSHVSLPETVHNGVREEVSLDINSSEGDSSSDEIGVSSSSVNRKPRSHSSGIYGKPPPLDKIQAVAVGEGHIMDPEATRTMLGIVRQHWPVGCFTYREAELATQGEFQETILKEFRRYYKYEDGISERQGNKHVRTYVKNRMPTIKSDEKRRAFKRAAKNGKPLIDQQPQYFSKELWISFCNHFLGEKHASKSEINKKNRMKKVMVHATGSTSHTKIKRDLTLEKNRPPTRLEIFERTYKRKSTQNYTSEEARAIAERYKSILDERRQTSNELDEPLEWWIEACGPVKKNRILGEPRISANELLNGSYHENQNPKSPTQSTCGLCLSDDVFFNAVKKTLRTIDSSALFKEASVSREQVQSLAEHVVSGDMSNSENGIAQGIKEELIRLVVTTIEGIYSTIHQSVKESQTNDQAPTSSSANDLEDARN